MDRGKRVAGEPVSDFVAVYGLPRSLDYLTFVQLWLNLPRQASRSAVTYADAAAVAAGTKSAPPDWYYDAAETPHEAERCLTHDRETSLLSSARDRG